MADKKENQKGHEQPFLKRKRKAAGTIGRLFAEETAICAKCGKLVLASAAHKDSQGKRYCTSCWRT